MGMHLYLDPGGQPRNIDSDHVLVSGHQTMCGDQCGEYDEMIYTVSGETRADPPLERLPRK